jgi:DNA-binding response OmpR family regulator
MTNILGLSALIAEDEFLVALDAEAMLRALGAARIEVVGTFEAAQERIDAEKFDVVILDVNLNGKMSFPLAQAATSRGMPVIFCTGYSLQSRPLTGFERGICVTKPYTRESLATALKAALEAKPASTAIAPSP